MRLISDRLLRYSKEAAALARHRATMNALMRVLRKKTLSVRAGDSSASWRRASESPDRERDLRVFGRSEAARGRLRAAAAERRLDRFSFRFLRGWRGLGQGMERETEGEGLGF